MEERPIIQFQNIEMSFADQVVLHDINLDIAKREFVTLLGPSGCGKTTLLRILGGFLRPTKGEIIFDGRNITLLPPYKRELNTVFQKYALFPNMTVYGNIAFGLKLKKLGRDIIDQKVMRMMKLIDLEGFEERSCMSLSGGQQQRVAIARALVNEPKVLLLDEPLGALDVKLRREMQYELKSIQQEVGITFIYVTHDQEEALTMSDKIVILCNGVIQQIGTPETIYNEPGNRFVADFIGESNIIPGRMIADHKVLIDAKEYECADSGFASGELVDIVIRPEDLDIVAENEGMMTGTVESAIFKGNKYEIVVETEPGTTVTVNMRIIDDKANEVMSADGNEKISANDFLVDIEDVESLDEKEIIARANAQAWNPRTDASISISTVKFSLKNEAGIYPVTFQTKEGTMIQKIIRVVNQPFVTDEKKDEGIMAFNFMKTKSEIAESVALDTDLKTWANAQAWRLSNEQESLDIYVDYDFDIDDLYPGREYLVRFMTEGRELKLQSINKIKEGTRVGLRLDPDDIHVMKKNIK